MMDSQEMPLQEEGKQENNLNPVNESPETNTFSTLQTKEEVITRLKEIAEVEDNPSKQELDTLKQIFYKIHKAEATEARVAYLEAGGEAESYVPKNDQLEEDFKTFMGIIKKKRAEQIAEQERIKTENLQRKINIIERIKIMASTPEEANQTYKEFKELQSEWKEIKNIPLEKANELWKNYQHYVEQFYDLLKLNSEFREYDFKKNLEIKNKLCETAERLAEEKDPISAFQQLQTLHQEYKETGPVAKELRDEVWARFKTASTTINKLHQQHFEELKSKEEGNLTRKTTLCEQVEAIHTGELSTFSEWDAKTKEIIEIQAQWKTIGFAPQKMNVKIFERFRKACDNFFEQKADFFKKLKEELNENLNKKKELCEKAEELKDSTDWKTTGEAFSKIQKEWKTIGSVPKKYSDALWKRFIAACDHFFEQRNQATASQRGEEAENLSKKKNIIEQLKALVEEQTENAIDSIRELTKEWNETGHVPFKEKDKIYKEYRELTDQLYKELNINSARRRLNNFKNSIKTTVEKEGNSLIRERDRLMRAFENMRSDIQTYENNLGFLSCNSKSGNSLVNEMKRKVEKLKDELILIRQKIEAIDQELK